MRSTVVIVAVFSLCLETTAQLKLGDEGVCIRPWFHRGRSREPDQTHKPGRLKCCNGWQYNYEKAKCEFFCRMDCGAGKCIGPNKCSCEPPNAIINNKCVKPVCESACINATCTGHNICSCMFGYEKLNDTHCAPPCPIGYKRQDIVGRDPTYCEPICDSACVNATCTGHNTCSCISGYEKLNDTHCTPPCPTGYKRQKIVGTGFVQCEPICDLPCVNATCTGHNTCSCIPNYEKLNYTHCAPPCPTGYKRQKTVGIDLAQCEPICDAACVNATCTGHNICSCISGYEYLNDTHCSPPCPTGYKRQKTVGIDLAQCEPICDAACVNATCTGHNICSCISGYEYLNDTHCSPPCPTGYKRPKTVEIDLAQCEPICDTACVNATCTGLNICSCISGYEKLNDTHCALPCPTGYKRQKTVGIDLVQCEPICDTACINATCTGHNICSCISGYEKLNDTYCALPCPTGYKRQKTVGIDLAECVPICDTVCVNAMCTGHNTCLCIFGYEKLNDTHCAPPCPAGYKRPNSSRWQCDPICDNCQHGDCIAPYDCLCNKGYTMKDGKCVPDCLSCSDGVCTAPGVCSTVLCKDCDGNCTEANECLCSDKRPCFSPADAESAGITSSPRLAGLELTWLVGGVIGLVILTSLIVILSHMWKRRKEYGAKTTDAQGTYTGSVVYTVSNTLLHNRDDLREDNEYDGSDEKEPNEMASETLLNHDDDGRKEYKIAL